MPRKMKQEIKHCQFCGKQLERNRYRNSLEDFKRFLSRKYCDVLCMAQAMKKEKVSISRLRQIAKKHRAGSCANCGKKEDLHTHHIDNNPENNVPANLTTLCGSCHQKWHWENGRVIRKRPITYCTVCGKKAEARGFCMNHYRHFMKYGNPLLTKRSGHSDGTIYLETKTELTD